MMDQAADIAFFAIMAAVAPLLLTMMACLNTSPGRPTIITTIPQHLSIPLLLSCAPQPEPFYPAKGPVTLYVSPIWQSVQVQSNYLQLPQRSQQNHFHAKGGKTNGERKH